MRSYRAYGLVIALPYLLLTLTFHTYLQLYEQSPPHDSNDVTQQRQHHQQQQRQASRESEKRQAVYFRLRAHTESAPHKETADGDAMPRRRDTLSNSYAQFIAADNVHQHSTVDNKQGRRRDGRYHNHNAAHAPRQPIKPRSNTDDNNSQWEPIDHKDYSNDIKKNNGDEERARARYELIDWPHQKISSNHSAAPGWQQRRQQQRLKHESSAGLKATLEQNKDESISEYTAAAETVVRDINNALGKSDNDFHKSSFTAGAAEMQPSKLPARTSISAPLLENCVVNKNDTNGGTESLLNDHIVDGQFQMLVPNYFYSAYLDDRQSGNPVIKVISLIARLSRPLLYCHFINAESAQYTQYSLRVKTTRVEYYEMCENHAKKYGGWILTCKLPVSMHHLPPCNVIISTHSTYDSKRTGNIQLPVYRLRPLQNEVKQDFGVCVPPLFGYISSTTFIEFIELTQLLGAQHFLFYGLQVTTEIQKVLNYYTQLGVVTVMPWQLPVDRNSIWYYGQLLAINDCLYRSMHAFKYVAFNDLDEFIVPHKYDNWSQMISNMHENNHNNNSSANSTNTTHLDQSQYCGYSFQSAFFDPQNSAAGILYELESGLRTKLFSTVRKKILVAPDRIYELGIHHISKPFPESLHTYNVEPAIAFVHHYRECITDFDHKMKCHTFVRDDGLSRYIPALRHTVHQVLWQLKEAEKYGDQPRMSGPLPNAR